MELGLVSEPKMYNSVENGVLIHLFRKDLRLHDMPTLSAALKCCSILYPVYIFNEDDIMSDKISYNQLRFLLDALNDIDLKLQKINGKLFTFCGKLPVILSALFKKWQVTHLSYEQDFQPSWEEMEFSIHKICKENNVNIIQKVSHTLWNIEDLLKANSGKPPVTYNLFCQVAEVLGSPPRPEPNLIFDDVFLPFSDMGCELPSSPEQFGVKMECEEQKNKVWIGGETAALQHLKKRLKFEEEAYKIWFFMPTQVQPDLLGKSVSMSAALSLGCLSVRKFYWCLRDLYESINPEEFIQDGLVGQLIWREYFYTMCKNNRFYSSMENNPICLNIPWCSDKNLLLAWKEGKTGFPFIDAVMRQLHQEGWIHHIARNAVACFLTRGDLWISWEEGLKVFMKYLLDADLPVCAGNWMWVSSSAFESVLQCSACISPISYGRRFEPSGQYIRKYVPELKNMPLQYLFEPWLAPISVQESSCCIIGKDYPNPVVNHNEAFAKNSERMTLVKKTFLPKTVPVHCMPSNSAETRYFMFLPKNCVRNMPH